MQTKYGRSLRIFLEYHCQYFKKYFTQIKRLNLSSAKDRLERHVTAKKTVFMITCEIFENFKNSMILV